MDFGDTPAQAAFRAEARAWLDANAPSKGSPEAFDQMSSPGRSAQEEQELAGRARAWQARLAADGWACLDWPPEYGGRGASAVEAIIFDEEQSRYGVSMSIFMAALSMAAPTLMAWGTGEQKQRFLNPIRRGEMVFAQLFSEPNAGSDLAGLQTRAVRDGDEFVVNGQKVWNSYAHMADWGILLARTDSDVPKHQGLTYFLVEMHSEGLDPRPLRQMTGGAEFNETFLDDVRIPAENAIGGVNNGWAVAQTTLNSERAAVGAQSSAVDVGALVDLARHQGRCGDPAVRQALAEAWIRSEVLRYLGMRVYTALSRGTEIGPEASIMKILTGDHIRDTSQTAMELLGPGGMLSDDSWVSLMVSHFAHKIGGGTPEIQRNVIGERILGLPREPRADKGVPFRELKV
ncbi:acyl-CoA dehydrogenase family protein [Candidatus Poriferisocius sp.]|uniref:acyl-CoA dehydrogenase family protein n=1 Tax=Candidatus Poriferisocius sp. TaxID=3101276 RepID=UPI003B01A262